MVVISDVVYDKISVIMYVNIVGFLILLIKLKLNNVGIKIKDSPPIIL